MPLWAATTCSSCARSRPVACGMRAGRRGARPRCTASIGRSSLLLGLGVAALADPRRAVYFRSPAPWVTIAVGRACARTPCRLAFRQRLRAVLLYAVAVHGRHVRGIGLGATAFGYLAGQRRVCGVPLVVVILATVRARRPLRDMAWPATPERRLAAAAFWATLRVAGYCVAPPAEPSHLMWSMPAWTLLPVMLLSSPLLAVYRQAAARIVMVAVLFPLVVLAAAPAIAVVTHRAGRHARGCPFLALGGAGRAPVARNQRPAAAAVQQLRGFQLRRGILPAEPSADG